MKAVKQHPTDSSPQVLRHGRRKSAGVDVSSNIWIIRLLETSSLDLIFSVYPFK